MASTPLTLESLNPDGSLRSAQFWHGALERAGKSAAQGFLTGFGFATAGDAVVPEAHALDGSNWLVALTLAGTMFVLSVCTSILNPQFVAGKVGVLEKPVPVAAATGGTAVVPDQSEGRHVAGSSPTPREEVTE